MKLRVIKKEGFFIVQERAFLIWRDLYDERRKLYIKLKNEEDALKFLSKYSSYKENKIIITINSEDLKSKFPQYYI